MASLRKHYCHASVSRLSVAISGDTIVERPSIRRISSQRFHDPVSRFPPRGPRRSPVPPLLRYYQDTTTPWRSFRFTSLPSFGDTMVARGYFCSRYHREPSIGPGVVHPVSPAGAFSDMETTGPPKFPWNLICSFAHVPATPAGRAFLTIHETPMLPPLVQRRRLRQQYFRGSLAWLPNSLSTPRSAGYPITTQDLLPAAGQALPDGTSTRRGSAERFLSQLLIDFPLSRASWRNEHIPNFVVLR